MAEMHRNAREWDKFTGHVCESCGQHTELRYLFPILVALRKADPGYRGRGDKRMCPVCLECIAAGRMPEGINQADLPWYDPKGNRVNGGKIHVSMG
jgi:hypothetical protein